MYNWQLTATTILCDTYSSEVTIIVYKDGKLKCTGAANLPGKKGRLGVISCAPETCSQIAEYKAKLDKEEQGG